MRIDNQTADAGHAPPRPAVAEAPILFVTGRDPRRYPACAHSAYVRAHAMAAVKAGRQAHVICLGAGRDTGPAAYGMVHAFPTPEKSVRQSAIRRQAAPLAAGILAVAESLGAPRIVLHSFGVWSYAAAGAAEALKARGIGCANLVGSYTTYLDEALSQRRGLTPSSGRPVWIRFWLELMWTRLVVVRYERHGYRSADRVLTNHQSVRQMIADRFGADVKADVIPFSIEQEFVPLPSPPRPPRAPGPVRILCVARHNPRKGVEILLRALASLKAEGLAFSATFVSGGVLLDRHRELAVESGLAGDVALPGWVDAVEPYLEEADLFVLPSLEEQSGSLALLEAMRMGLPCIASGCDGIPEDLRDGIDGLLVPPGDVDGLAAAIRRAILDDELRTRLSAAALARFETNFSAAGFVATLDRVYREASARLAS